MSSGKDGVLSDVAISMLDGAKNIQIITAQNYILSTIANNNCNCLCSEGLTKEIE